MKEKEKWMGRREVRRGNTVEIMELQKIRFTNFSICGRDVVSMRFFSELAYSVQVELSE